MNGHVTRQATRARRCHCSVCTFLRENRGSREENLLVCGIRLKMSYSPLLPYYFPYYVFTLSIPPFISLYRVTLFIAHISTDKYFLNVATSVYYLPGLNDSSSSAEQLKGTCKEACNKTFWAIGSVIVCYSVLLIQVSWRLTPLFSLRCRTGGARGCVGKKEETEIGRRLEEELR